MNMKYTLVFVLGFLSCAFLFYGFSYSNVALPSVPFSDGNIPFATGLVVSDVNAPSDWVSSNDIIVFDDMVILRVSNATLSSYADSGSMKPVFDEGANGIRVVPQSVEDVNVGDIVSYRFGKILVVHRVVEKGFDEEGVYFIMKGDNNLLSDERVRFEQIEYVTIGVIW